MAGDRRAIGRLSGSAGEARARARQDADERRAAPNILNPNEVRGDYDAGRLLMTTLGGQVRPITADDLAMFRHNARMAGQRFKGGITARQVVDMSLFDDRKRARRQITTAVPTAGRGLRGSNGQVSSLEVRFITNAGPDSDVSRHHVTVEFTGYQTAIASGAESPQRAAARLRKEGVRFDCDCGRHRYWFRYIATIGRYNAGRPETGYPKIRNPKLNGVACKHVLRVMAEIEGGSAVQAFLARAIAKGRQSEDGAGHIRQRQQEAERLAEKQARRPRGGPSSTGDRDYDRARRALRRQSRATTTKPKRTASGSKRMQALGATPGARDKLVEAARQLGLTPEQAVAILQGGKR
ncbi:hypothetical protein [Halomonas salipaludis]|uniref:SWIM-type domain-containing protein n=1 Tax=Halomonas salipaludis TaxID=2032625 RepID=A0A2A2F3M9_9GAMM|nr:hypothetical protein [Halomonas salipaludis]PAU79219.1 hypothetical protein CK498_02290 [Halomonas salipaludis]